jgi:transmembrane sensor
MSGAVLSDNTQDVQAHAAEWLAERRYAENWTAEEQARLDAWLAASLEHEVAYWRLDAAWTRTERLAALRAPDADDAAQRKRTLAALRMFAAAMVVVVLGAGMFLFYPDLRGAKIYSTPVGGRETITLADGSSIELNTDTVVSFQSTHGRRLVSLEKGEAFFEVKHDSAHPFIVQAMGQQITDIGTKFSVSSAAGKVEVALLEGRARLEALGSARPSARMLVPGDVAIATADSISVNRKSSGELVSALSWRRGVLIFDRTPLSAVAAQFNRYNDTKLAVAEVAGRMKIDGTFPSNNLQDFVQLVHGVLGLRVVKQGNQILISR